MMERNEIAEKIKKILAKVLKHDKFEMNDELTATEVEGWDSLSHITIISEIEEAFSIKFKLKELNKLKNIGSLIEIVQSKL
jgi:acyl carrier protein